jgi:hypothetical protein
LSAGESQLLAKPTTTGKASIAVNPIPKSVFIILDLSSLRLEQSAGEGRPERMET